MGRESTKNPRKLTFEDYVSVEFFDCEALSDSNSMEKKLEEHGGESWAFKEKVKLQYLR